MVPYIQERFQRLGTEMDTFSLPKRVRSKGTGEIAFETIDVQEYRGNPIIDKYLQTYKDYHPYLDVYHFAPLIHEPP